MTYQPSADLKIFSLNEANASLPLVRLIVRDIVRLANSILECRERLDFLRDSRCDEGLDVLEPSLYEDELDHIEDSLDEDSMLLKSYINELEELGIEVRSLTEGQIDFPAMIGGNLVYLCWAYGEESVDYWRELEDEFNERQHVDLMFADVVDVPHVG